MDNIKLKANDHDSSNQLISEKATNQAEISIAQVETLTGKEAGATMLDEVTNHFKTTFSNVAKGKASASEYLEVGVIALGTAAVGTFAAGRMMQRSAPLVGRYESATSALAPNAAGFTGQTNALASNVIKFERTSVGAIDALGNKGAVVTRGFASGADGIKGRSYPEIDAFAEVARRHSGAGLATVEEGKVFTTPQYQAAVARVDALSHPGRSFRWTPPEGSGRFDVPMSSKNQAVPLRPNATFELESLYTTNKELAGIIPEMAAYGDDLYINLKGSISVTDEGLKHFIKAKDMLKKLDLSGTSVTENGATRLKMALPNTEILFDKSQALTPLGRAIAKASLQAPISPWERAAYQWVPPRQIAEVVFRKPH